jgi:hypothetical protein
LDGEVPPRQQAAGKQRTIYRTKFSGELDTNYFPTGPVTHNHNLKSTPPSRGSGQSTHPDQDIIESLNNGFRLLEKRRTTLSENQRSPKAAT